MKRHTRILVSLFVILTWSTVGFGPARAETKSLVRIYVTGGDQIDRLPRTLDVAGRKMGEWIDVVATEEELVEIQSTGLSTDIIHQDVEAYANSVKGYYHTFPELISNLEAFAFIFSTIVRLDTLVTTYEGRPLLMLKISDNVNVDEADEPELLFMGLHHAREWPSLEIIYYMVETLLFNYGIDPHITDIIDSREIWVLPCVNPDGYAYCHDQGHDWRKNRRYFSQFDSYGVDLNRNYDGACNGDPEGAWGTTRTSGTTHIPWESVYCGPYPFSEVEIQTVRDLFLAREFVFSVSYHTYAEMVIYPWGYSNGTVTPDHDLIAEIGEEMASRIATQSGVGTYQAAQAPDIGYTTTGDTDDWAYGYEYYVAGSSCLCYTVEACSQFHPTQYYLDQINQENLAGALYLCDIADSVSSLLIPRVMPPAIDPMGSVPGGDYTVSWSPQNPEAGADFYRLDELSGPWVVVDDAEGDGAMWELAGFSINDVRSHSSSHSFHASSDLNSACDAMTTIEPYIVSGGDSLTFWCWYNIEEVSDMAYAEISADGRHFHLLDTTATFTGSSIGWVRKAYELEDYVGQSVYFRFRYTTDLYVEEEGLYVDDISPVTAYANSTILSDGIADTFYTFTGHAPGIYTYRVKGHSAARGWGDWSACREVDVGSMLPRGISDLTARLSGGVQLSWSPVTVSVGGDLVDIDHYVIHRDDSFAFAASAANSLAVATQPRYEDSDAQVGNTAVNHYYLVRAVDGQGNKSSDSNCAGEFDHRLTRVK